MNPESNLGSHWWLKACRKCKGALHLCKDSFGYYRKCINCGAYHYQPPHSPPEISRQHLPTAQAMP